MTPAPISPTTPPDKQRFSVREITALLGGKYPSTIVRTIERLGLKPAGFTRDARPRALYRPAQVERIRKATAIAVPPDLFTCGQIARQLDRDQTTIWRILRVVLKIKPDYKLPRGACYWHKDRIPVVAARLRSRSTR